MKCLEKNSREQRIILSHSTKKSVNSSKRRQKFTENGLKADSKKVEAVKKCAAPESKEEARSF